ncbi:hypothetical protein [Pelagibaculum spongiae]|uniref:Uncharacterized protein n=1 Tax=Pelagibaculum spongiae TaxID=2080658 RepID=A0A2V1H2M8_9GAMM|nr:hypothetical protein [Pelagibaculum spongiae]PVZ72230.1 hypothetical protein DC094_04245 [Pelagibaculum spongiae]
MPKWLRISILLVVLVLVAGQQFLGKQRVSSWDEPVWIAIYPLISDDREAQHFIDTLSIADLKPLERWFAKESERYGMLFQRPIQLHLMPTVNAPSPPEAPADRSPWKVAYWSLELRYWAWKYLDDGFPTHSKIVMKVYPKSIEKLPGHSTGLEKLKLGIVKIRGNRIELPYLRFLIGHELLHTLGASDKYSYADHSPYYPAAFLEPDKKPLYPQNFAEIMAGVIPKTSKTWQPTNKLSLIKVGDDTAREIGWQK